MRKIIESALVSLDGVIGDPMSWASAYFNEDAQASALTQLLASDGMLMGRGTYEYFAPAWPSVPGDYAARINRMPKYVFSNTLDRAEWTNSTIVRGDVGLAAADLKQQDGQDLIVYGHGQRLFRDGGYATFELVAADMLTTGVVMMTYRPA